MNGIEKQIVLVGAGNAHLQLIKQWAMDPLPGVGLVLVDPEPVLLYSALVPSYLAGEIPRDALEIDLANFCGSRGVRFIQARVEKLDASGKRVEFGSRPALGYDAVSISVGAKSRAPEDERNLPVKPLPELVRRLDRFFERAEANPENHPLVIAGGGASGCEIALAIRRRFPTLPVSLVQSDPSLVPNLPRRTARALSSALEKRGVKVRLAQSVERLEKNGAILSTSEMLPCEALIWATTPLALTLAASSGLEVDADGFLLVNESLQSISDPAVFGAGDCIRWGPGAHLPKNGVYAVREGEALTDILRAFCTGRSLPLFRPQKRYVSLLNLADGRAVLSRGKISFAARSALALKNRIDRKWMESFSPVPMNTADASEPMRCGGCGSKIAGEVLTRALSRLEVARSPLVLVGCQDAEDASVHRPPEGKLEIQTIDFFKTFVDDPFLFGRLTALHATSDLHAMNAVPFSALALVTLPVASLTVQEDWLYETLSGAIQEFRELGITLMGGHTSESESLGLGFALTGYSAETELFGKRKLRPGDVLVLTKPIGTGALLAALMRHRLPLRWREPLFASMLTSSAEASKIFRQNGVRGCTDVTGFGLAGHLLEMLAATRLRARLSLAAVPVLRGFDDLAREGVLSTLQPANEKVAFRMEGKTPPAWLFDPQTCGGLLAGVPPDRAETAVKALRENGYPFATAIGVLETAPAAARRALILE